MNLQHTINYIQFNFPPTTKRRHHSMSESHTFQENSVESSFVPREHRRQGSGANGLLLPSRRSDSPDDAFATTSLDLGKKWDSLGRRYNRLFQKSFSHHLRKLFERDLKDVLFPSRCMAYYASSSLQTSFVAPSKNKNIMVESQNYEQIESLSDNKALNAFRSQICPLNMSLEAIEGFLRWLLGYFIQQVNASNIGNLSEPISPFPSFDIYAKVMAKVLLSHAVPRLLFLRQILQHAPTQFSFYNPPVKEDLDSKQSKSEIDKTEHEKKHCDGVIDSIHVLLSYASFYPIDAPLCSFVFHSQTGTLSSIGNENKVKSLCRCGSLIANNSPSKIASISHLVKDIAELLLLQRSYHSNTDLYYIVINSWLCSQLRWIFHYCLHIDLTLLTQRHQQGADKQHCHDNGLRSLPYHLNFIISAWISRIKLKAYIRSSSFGQVCERLETVQSLKSLEKFLLSKAHLDHNSNSSILPFWMNLEDYSPINYSTQLLLADQKVLDDCNTLNACSTHSLLFIAITLDQFYCFIRELRYLKAQLKHQQNRSSTPYEKEYINYLDTFYHNFYPIAIITWLTLLLRTDYHHSYAHQYILARIGHEPVLSRFKEDTLLLRRLSTFCAQDSLLNKQANVLFSDTTQAGFIFHLLQFRLSVSIMSPSQHQELLNYLTYAVQSEQGLTSKVHESSSTRILSRLRSRLLRWLIRIKNKHHQYCGGSNDLKKDFFLLFARILLLLQHGVTMERDHSTVMAAQSHYISASSPKKDFFSVDSNNEDENTTTILKTASKHNNNGRSYLVDALEQLRLSASKNDTNYDTSVSNTPCGKQCFELARSIPPIGYSPKSLQLPRETIKPAPQQEEKPHDESHCNYVCCCAVWMCIYVLKSIFGDDNVKQAEEEEEEEETKCVDQDSSNKNKQRNLKTRKPLIDGFSLSCVHHDNEPPATLCDLWMSGVDWHSLKNLQNIFTNDFSTSCNNYAANTTYEFQSNKTAEMLAPSSDSSYITEIVSSLPIEEIPVEIAYHCIETLGQPNSTTTHDISHFATSLIHYLSYDSQACTFVIQLSKDTIKSCPLKPFYTLLEQNQENCHHSYKNINFPLSLSFETSIDIMAIMLMSCLTRLNSYCFNSSYPVAQEYSLLGLDCVKKTSALTTPPNMTESCKVSFNNPQQESPNSLENNYYGHYTYNIRNFRRYFKLRVGKIAPLSRRVTQTLSYETALYHLCMQQKEHYRNEAIGFHHPNNNCSELVISGMALDYLWHIRKTTDSCNNPFTMGINLISLVANLLCKELETDSTLAEEVAQTSVLIYRSALCFFLSSLLSLLTLPSSFEPLKDLERSSCNYALQNLTRRLHKLFSFRLQCLFLDTKKLSVVIQPVLMSLLMWNQDSTTAKSLTLKSALEPYETMAVHNSCLKNEINQERYLFQHFIESSTEHDIGDDFIMPSPQLRNALKDDPSTCLLAMQSLCYCLRRVACVLEVDLQNYQQDDLQCRQKNFFFRFFLNEEEKRQAASEAFTTLSRALFALLPSFTSDVSLEFGVLQSKSNPTWQYTASSFKQHLLAPPAALSAFDWIDQARQAHNNNTSVTSLQQKGQRISTLRAAPNTTKSEDNSASCREGSTSIPLTSCSKFSAYAFRPFNRGDSPSDWCLIAAELPNALLRPIPDTSLTAPQGKLFARLLIIVLKSLLSACTSKTTRSMLIARIYSRLSLWTPHTGSLQKTLVACSILESETNLLKRHIEKAITYTTTQRHSDELYQLTENILANLALFIVTMEDPDSGSSSRTLLNARTSLLTPKKISITHFNISSSSEVNNTTDPTKNVMSSKEANQWIRQLPKNLIIEHIQLMSRVKIFHRLVETLANLFQAIQLSSMIIETRQRHQFESSLIPDSSNDLLNRGKGILKRIVTHLDLEIAEIQLQTEVLKASCTVRIEREFYVTAIALQKLTSNNIANCLSHIIKRLHSINLLTCEEYRKKKMGNDDDDANLCLYKENDKSAAQGENKHEFVNRKGVVTEYTHETCTNQKLQEYTCLSFLHLIEGTTSRSNTDETNRNTVLPSKPKRRITPEVVTHEVASLMTNQNTARRSISSGPRVQRKSCNTYTEDITEALSSSSLDSLTENFENDKGEDLEWIDFETTDDGINEIDESAAIIHKEQNKENLVEELNKSKVSPHWKTFIEGLFCSADGSISAKRLSEFGKQTSAMMETNFYRND